MSLILADTSGIYSLFNQQDKSHEKVSHFYNALPRQTEIIVLEYILLEIMTLFRARGYSEIAIQFRHALAQSRIFKLQYSSPQLEWATFDIFRQYDDKEWSYADCALFAAAKILSTRQILSLDHHIEQMGLMRLPR